MTGSWASRIVVGYDDTAAAAAALEFAAHECRLRDDTLVVLHQAEGPEVPDIRSSARDAAAQLHRVGQSLKDAVAPATAGLAVDVRVVECPIAATLVDVGSDASAIVLGATVHHATLGAAFDSVSRELAGTAPCPLIVVPASENGPRRVERVVCGVNRSPASVAALRWGAHEAGLRQVPLQVVQVGEPATAGEPALTDWVAGQLPEPRCDVTSSCMTGAPVGRLLDAADRNGLIVIGHHEPHGRRWHRSVARRLVAQIQTPVAVVPIRATRLAPTQTRSTTWTLRS